jgi:hypothetical protein
LFAFGLKCETVSDSKYEALLINFVKVASIGTAGHEDVEGCGAVLPKAGMVCMDVWSQWDRVSPWQHFDVCSCDKREVPQTFWGARIQEWVCYSTSRVVRRSV